MSEYDDLDIPPPPEWEPTPLTKAAQPAAKFDTLRRSNADTATSRRTVPDRMIEIEIKCRCGATVGYSDPASRRPFCAGCGRNL